MEKDLRNKPYDVLVHKLYYWAHGAKVPKHQPLDMKTIKPRSTVIRTDFDLQMYVVVDTKGVFHEMSDALLARVKNYGYELQLGISSITNMPWVFSANVLMDMVKETAKNRQSTSAVLKSRNSERWYVAVAQTMPLKTENPEERADKIIVSWVDIEAYSKLLHESGYFKSHDRKLEKLKLV